ncbi:MAG: hypothetical protein L0216_04010 [Planctomycetales bacterium]|nr:hypothetical protein [Planctomycetales bacterium]
MKTRSLAIPFLYGAAALAALAGVGALAPRALADVDDIKFGDALARRKFYALAGHVFKRVLADPKSTPGQKANAELGLVAIFTAKARAERDPDKQKALFDEALKKFDEILQKPGATPTVQAKFQYAALLTDKGDSLVDAMERADTTEQQDSLKAEARKVFGQVADLFGEFVKDALPKFQSAKDLETGRMDRTKCPEDMENDLIQAWLSQAEALYKRGMISDPQARDKDLRQALEVSGEFGWEFEDKIPGLWGAILQGQIHSGLGKFQDAAARLKGVWEFKLDPEDMPKIENPRFVACWRLTEVHVKAGEHQKALEAVARLEKEFPSYLDKDAGQDAALARGDAYAGMQDFNSAIGEALKVVGARYPMRYAKALKKLAGWSSMDPSAGAKIKVLQGRGFRQQAFDRPERYLDAIASFQEAAAAIQTPEELKEWGVLVWKEIGECFFALDRYTEAGLAYQRGASVNRDDPQAAECAYWAFRSFQERFKVSKDAFDKQHYRDARQRLMNDFPKSPQVGDLPFFEAKDLEDDGKYLEAAKAYELVKPDSRLYEVGLVKTGSCYYREYLRLADEAKAKGGGAPPTEYLDKSEKYLKEFLQKTQGEMPKETEPEKVTQRKVARGLATFFLGRVAEARQAWAKVLEILAGFAESQKAIGQLTIGADGLYMELSALVELKRPPEADAKFQELKAYLPTYRFLGVAGQKVGKLFDTEADRLEKDGKTDEAIAKRRHAAWLLYQWLMDDGKAQNKDNLLGVAARVKEVADTIRKAGEKGDLSSTDLEDEGRFFQAAGQLYTLLRTKAAKLALDGATQERIDRELGESLYARAQLLDHVGDRDASTAEWQAALNLLQAMHRKFPKTIAVIRRLADAYMRLDKPEDALKLWMDLVKAYKEGTSDWFEAKYYQFEALLRMGKQKEVQGLLENIRLLYPALGGGETAQKFKELRKKAGLKD